MKQAGSIVLGIFGVVLLVLGFSRSLALFSETGMVDFRNRVVAARQAELGLNPYTFKWDPSRAETLLDPTDDLTARYTRLTSPPTTLYLHHLFSDLPFPTQKKTNFALNWIALIAIAVWMRTRLSLPSGPVLFATGAFALSALWTFHVERGQQYVYFVVLMILAVLPPFRSSTSFFSALSVYFRPTAGITALAAIREKNPWRALLLAAGIGLVCLVPVFLKYPLIWWMDYFASARDWYAHHWGFHDRLPPAALSIPGAPEGDPTLHVAWNFGTVGSLFQHYAAKAGWIPGYEFGLVLTACLTGLSGWMLWRGREEPLEIFVGRFFSAVYLIDYFLPAPRSGYNVVLFFPMIVLAMTTLMRNRRDLGSLCILGGTLWSMVAIGQPDLSPRGVEFFYLLGAGITLLKASSAFQDPGLQLSSPPRP